MTTRRGFLAAMLAACAAPAVVKAGVLMPVRPPIWTPAQEYADKGGLLSGEIGHYESVRFVETAGPRIDIFTAAGALLATIPMGAMQFDLGPHAKELMSLEGGRGQVLATGVANRFKLSGTGMFDMEGPIGPGGLNLDNPAVVPGQEVSLLQFALEQSSYGRPRHTLPV